MTTFVPPTRGDGPLRFAEDIPNTPGQSETIPSSWYTDPARFELERKYVLNPSWQIMCRSEELTETGDHVVWEGHGETIVITRRKDGGLDGFEIAAQGEITPAQALALWQSPPHLEVIQNAGIWSDASPWPAMGCGLQRSFAVVWFGGVGDPQIVIPP